MLAWDWEAIAGEVLQGDDDALRLLPEDVQTTLRHARALYRDGSTPDAEISALISTITDRRPVRLH